MTTAALRLRPSCPPPLPARVARAVLTPGALAIAALEPGGCRWPVGEVDEAAFHFCNGPCRGRSYCEAHRRLAHRRAAR